MDPAGNLLACLRPFINKFYDDDAECAIRLANKPVLLMQTMLISPGI